MIPAHGCPTYRRSTHPLARPRQQRLPSRHAGPAQEGSTADPTPPEEREDVLHFLEETFESRHHGIFIDKGPRSRDGEPLTEVEASLRASDRNREHAAHVRHVNLLHDRAPDAAPRGQSAGWTGGRSGRTTGPSRRPSGTNSGPGSAASTKMSVRWSPTRRRGSGRTRWASSWQSRRTPPITWARSGRPSR